jgi:hypothetical protein
MRAVIHSADRTARAMQRRRKPNWRPVRSGSRQRKVFKVTYQIRLEYPVEEECSGGGWIFARREGGRAGHPAVQAPRKRRGGGITSGVTGRMAATASCFGVTTKSGGREATPR